MAWFMAVTIGVLFGAGLYMMLRRSIIKLIIGLALISHGANLFIFSVAGLGQNRAPIIDEEAGALLGVFSDPVPQALILTAIVIGFAVQAFALVLIERAYRVLGTHDLVEMRSTDPLAPENQPLLEKE